MPLPQAPPAATTGRPPTPRLQPAAAAVSLELPGDVSLLPQ